MIARQYGLIAALFFTPILGHTASDPLDAWRDGAAKRTILGFVTAVSDPHDARFVPPADRIAVFDNDGTLWAEKPSYFPVLLAEDLVRAHSAANPAWRDTEPFRSILLRQPRPLSWADLRVITLATFTGMTPEAFRNTVNDWLRHTTHPRFARPYLALTYVPMQQLLALLRAHDFTVYVCSGAETEFVRAFAENLYGVRPEHVIGSDLELAYHYNDHAEVTRLPAFREPFNDHAGKAVNFMRIAARRPILAVGNADGDIEMLSLAEGGLSVLLNHDDDVREYAYSADEALRLAETRGWTVVSMMNDFASMFSPEP